MSKDASSDFTPPRIYLHRPTNRARVRIKGRDIYLGQAGSVEAAEAYARLVAELAAGRTPLPRTQAALPLSVAQVIGQWTVWMAQTYDPEGREPEQFRLSLAPVLELYGTTPAKDFDPPSLADVQREMARRGLARTTVNRRIMRLRTVWRWAESRKLVSRSACLGLYQPPGNVPADRQTSHQEAIERLKSMGWM